MAWFEALNEDPALAKYQHAHHLADIAEARASSEPKGEL